MKKYLLLLFGHILSAISFAQTNSFIIADSTSLNRLAGTKLLSDSSSVTCYSSGVWNDESLFIIKTDKYGKFVWKKKYANIARVITYDFIITNTDDIILTGEARGFPEGDYAQLFLLKLNQDGNILWSYRYGEILTGTSWGNKIEQAQDGGYIVSGLNDFESILMKFDGDGNVIWSKSFSPHDATASIELNDGSILCSSFDFRKFYITKYSPQGVLLKRKEISNEYFDLPSVKRFCKLQSGNIMLLMRMNNDNDAIVVCDSNLTILHSKYINAYAEDMLVNNRDEIELLVEKSYQLRNIKFSPECSKINEINSYAYGGVFFTTNIFYTTKTFDITHDNRLVYAIGDYNNIKIVTTDSLGFSCLTDTIGYYDSVRVYDITFQSYDTLQSQSVTMLKNTLTWNTSDASIVSDDSICIKAALTGIRMNVISEKFTVFPNPFSDDIQIDLAGKNNHIDYVRIFNADGIPVISMEHPGNTIALKNLANGIYFLEIKTGNYILHKKIVKQ